MRVLFTVATPHQVHVFRNVGNLLQERGDAILFAARDFRCTLDLLQYYKMPFVVYSGTMRGFVGKMGELAISELAGAEIAKCFQPNVIMGDSLLGYPSKMLGVPSICFTDGDYSSMYGLLYRTLYRCDLICTPEHFRMSIGKRHLRYPGYQELAYLHPRWYSPCKRTLSDEGIADDEPYSLVRFNAFDAPSHDAMKRQYDWDSRRSLVSKLLEYGKVIISSEARLPADLAKYRTRIHPAKIHDLLRFAQIVVAETAMAVESSLLGTPAIMIHPSNAGGKGATNCIDMERYGLQFNYPDYGPVVGKAEELLDSNSKKMFLQKRNDVLREKIDLTSFIVWLVDQVRSDPSSLREVRPDFSEFMKCPAQ